MLRVLLRVWKMHRYGWILVDKVLVDGVNTSSSKGIVGNSSKWLIPWRVVMKDASSESIITRKTRIT